MEEQSFYPRLVTQHSKSLETALQNLTVHKERMQDVCISTISTDKQSQKRLHWEVKVVYVSQNCYENKGGKLNKALVDDYSLL